MERRIITVVEDEVGEALKRAALVSAGTLLIAVVAVVTTLHAFVVSLEGRGGEESSSRAVNR